MPEDKIPEKKEEETSKITETEDGGVEVAVEEETPEEKIVQEKKEEEKKPVHKQDPLTNKVYAHDRILSNIQRNIEELKNTIIASSPSSTITSEQAANLDEIDKLAQTDWKSAVRKLATEEFKVLAQQDRERILQESQQITVANLMEENSKTVLSKHPELDDESSEKSQIFQEVLNNNPRWRMLPEGPLLTMYRMEEELRKRGYDVDGAIKERVEAEKTRIIRKTATGLPSSSASISGNKVVLSREQKEFCDLNGITYEEYARTLRRAGEKEGVEI